jgi:Family of unknown function (DUF5706)
MQISEKIQYLTDTHLHILENIKLADQKALVLLALNPAILSALYGAKLLIVDLAKGWVIVLCSVSTFGFLIIGLLLAIRVIYPRGESLARKLSGESSGSLTIPSKIARTYSKAEDYLNEINAADESRLLNELCTLIYARSYINDIKYFYLKWSILISGVGWSGGLLLLFVAGI